MGVKEQYRDYVMTGFVKRVEPVVADHGDGALLYDADGTEYIDCFAGISVTNAGHHNTKVLDAAKAQADKLVHACSYVYHVPSVGALAEKLAEITPGKLQKSFFGNGGAEAIEGAFRLAKRYSGRREFLAIESSFHGRSFATLSVTGNSGRKKGGGPYMPGVAFVPTPYCYRCFAETTPDKCDLLCARRVGEVSRLHLSGDVCAFIAEPVMGEGGIITPPDGYFKSVKEFLDEDGDPLHRRRGPERLRAHRQDVRHRALRRRARHHDHGQGHRRRLAAVGLHRQARDRRRLPGRRPPEHLRRQPGLVRRGAGQHRVPAGRRHRGVGARRAPTSRRASRTLMKTQPLIGDVRGKGLMIGVELIADPKTKAYGTAAAAFTRQYCLEHNLLIGVGGNFGSVLRIQPPLVIDEEQIDTVFDTVEAALAAFAKQN